MEAGVGAFEVVGGRIGEAKDRRARRTDPSLARFRRRSRGGAEEEGRVWPPLRVLGRVAPVKDAIITAALALGLATLITAHVALVWRLSWQRPRWRGLVALVVPPLAVIWALRAGWRANALVWLAAVGVYLIALIAALAGART